MKLWPSLIQSTREGISQRDFDSSKSPHDGHWEEILSRVEAHEMNTQIPSIDGMFLHLGDISRLFITNKNIPQLNTIQKLHWESEIIFLLFTNTSKNTQDPCASQFFLARICHHQRRPRGNDARYRCSQLARRLPKNKASRGWNQLWLDTHERTKGDGLLGWRFGGPKLRLCHMQTQGLTKLITHPWQFLVTFSRW